MEHRFSLSAAAEGSQTLGTLERTRRLFLVQPSFALRREHRWRFFTSLAATEDRFRVRETYFGFSAGNADFTAGKKILRWGTGYAFTPTGVLDPPRVATDPADRLNLNEGREMVKADWIQGRHGFTGVWAGGRRQTAAFRYNALLAGFDTSLIVAHDCGGLTTTGANFTRVFGQAVEVHAEAARRGAANAFLAGGKYTPPGGWSGVFEFYSEPRRRYAFFRLAKSRLRELPGWKEWDVAASLVLNLEDHSRITVVDAERRIGNHFALYARALFPAGRRWRSEYGMLPFSALVVAGLRFNL